MIQRVVVGWERKAIAEVNPQVMAMSADAARALEHLKRHDGELWSASYRTRTRRLEDEAAIVKGGIDRGRQLSDFRNHESEVEMNPGLTGK